MIKRYLTIIVILIILVFIVFGLLSLPRLLNEKKVEQIEPIPTTSYQIRIPTSTPIPTLVSTVPTSIPLAPTLNYKELKDPTDL